ncbi:MAG: HK97 gp10 family phage protein [Lentisphaeria bacterium]
MGSTIKYGDLSSQIESLLQEYGDEVKGKIDKALTHAGTAARNNVKENAPVRTGKYQASWSTRKETVGLSTSRVTVYSINRYQIVHLLEFGHAKRNGGRVAAIPHVASAQEYGNNVLMDELTKGL